MSRVAEPRKKSDRLALVLALVCGVVLYVLLWRLFSVGMAQSYDTTLYGRSMWGIAHGHGFNPVYGTHWLGVHANWGLFVLSPLTWVLEPARVLVVAQATAFAATVYLVLRASREAEGGMSPLGSVAATAWGLSLCATPLLINPFFFDAHPGLLAVPFLLAGLLRVERSRGWDQRATLLLVLAALVREEFAIIGAGCLVLAPAPNGWRLPKRVTFAAGLVCYFALYWFVGRGFFSEFASDRAGQAAADLFAGDGEAVGAFRTQLAVATLLVGGGLVLRGFRWLPCAVPGLVFVAITTKMAEHALNFHYSMFAAPVLVVAAVAGLRGLSANPDFLRFAWATTLVGAVVSAQLGSHPAGDRFEAEYFGYVQSSQPWQRECHALLGTVGDEEGVAMPAMFGPQFAGREHVWSIETLHRQLVERDPEINPNAGRVPPEIDVIALDNSRFASMGRVLANRHGFQLVGVAAGRLALLRRAEGGAPPALLIPGATTECREISIVWPETGLALCDLGRDSSGRVQATITRMSPSESGADAPTAFVLEVDGQPTVLIAMYGLLDPSSLPVGVGVAALSQDRVNAPEVRVHLQDLTGRQFAGTRIADGLGNALELGVSWQFGSTR